MPALFPLLMRVVTDIFNGSPSGDCCAGSGFGNDFDASDELFDRYGALISKRLRSAYNQESYRTRMEDATKIWRALYQYGERRLIQKLWEVDLMLYLVVSTPHPSKPEDVKGVRAKWWAWAEDLKSEGKALCYFARVGRGAVVIFDVTSNDELHELLTQWLNMVPVTFDTYPLVSREKALQFLK